MQPTIPSGTTLQNRYRVLQVLGHGGFGRTYLAEDVGRFNERCAIKELDPNQSGEHFSDKAIQLFQREATILYQINHPQIPKFQAIFEEDQRLFLVQDYVDGVTYRDLLNQRIAQNMAFSEAEVRQFLQQMLPVLAHIHSKGIIHRDISPDNIIQRRSDKLPVLIDFGVVKEVVTRLQMSDGPHHVTSVGKPGYAPSEQIQSGRAYPSSDLYALAVSAIVMLTGREPQDMFDDVNLAWNWQPYAPNVSPSLAQVLNKAISYRPGDRYQSVSEMAQALGATGRESMPAPGTVAPPSQVKTVAVGRQYQPTQVANVPRATAPPPRTVASPVTITPDDEPPSVWENPWAVLGIGAVLALVAGIGGWLVVSMLNRPPESTVSPTPSITLDPNATATPQPSPTATATTTRPVEYNQRLRLNPGQTRTVTGNLLANETINYLVNAEAGQTLEATMAREGVLLTVLNPDGEVIDSAAERVQRWQGELPTSGEYTLQLRPVEGLQSSNYEMEVSLSEVAPEPTPTETPEPTPTATPEPTPTETPEPTPTETPEPSIQEQRVQIPAGQTSVQVSGQVGPNSIRRYLVNAQEGQQLNIDLPTVSGPVTFDVRFPDGSIIPDASRVLAWGGELPASGDYLIDVQCSRQANYTLRISVE
jgi:serine/threonine protein kinase